MRQSASSACFWSGPIFAEGIMASGHAYRTNRSNTWPHRPGSAEHQINPCQRGAVHTWRIADARASSRHGGCSRLRSTGNAFKLAARRSVFDAVELPPPIKLRSDVAFVEALHPGFLQSFHKGGWFSLRLADLIKDRPSLSAQAFRLRSMNTILFVCSSR